MYIHTDFLHLGLFELLFLVVFHVDVNLATLGLGDQLPRDSAGHDTRQELPVLRVGVQPEVAVVDPAAFAVAGPDPRLPGPDSACPPLTPIRFAAAFEEA